MRRMIGIIGPAGAGKTTLAGFLAIEFQNLGYPALLEGFAVALKHEAREAVGWDGTKDSFGRELLQRIGSYRREQNPNYWVDLLLSRLGFSPTTPPVIIVSDVRYPNEAALFQCTGGTLIVISRQTERPSVSRASEHVSESLAWDLVEGSGVCDALAVDINVRNTGDLASLQDSARLIASSILADTVLRERAAVVQDGRDTHGVLTEATQ